MLPDRGIGADGADLVILAGSAPITPDMRSLGAAAGRVRYPRLMMRTLLGSGLLLADTGHLCHEGAKDAVAAGMWSRRFCRGSAGPEPQPGGPGPPGSPG